MTSTSFRVLVLLFALFLAVPGAGQVGPSSKEAPPDPKTDLDGPQSPRRPAPTGMTFVDQGRSDRRLAGYRTPEGFEVRIVAEGASVGNPVALAFADDGSPHLIEWTLGEEPRPTTETFTFKDGSKRTVPTLRKKKKDLIKKLSSSKDDGVWDRATVLFEDELPSSLLLHDGWVYLAGRGSVRRYKPGKPGDPIAVKEVVAHGFAGAGQRQVSGVTLGPDGWLYLSAGAGDNVVEGSDGSRATVLGTGAIFRCRPDGGKIAPFAIGFDNPHREVAFDLGGHLFHLDDDLEEGDRKFTGCRLLHVPEGADFGWRRRVGTGEVDPLRTAIGGERPGKMPPMLRTGRGTPGGLLIYNDVGLPEEHRGLLYYADPLRGLIRAYKVDPAGSTFRVTEEFELLAAPRDERFRPCQMVTGPDGAIYVLDRRSKSADPLKGSGQGRIYRISWSGTKDKPTLPLRPLNSWGGIAKLEDAALVKALSRENASDRERARRELVRRGEKNRVALIKLLGGEDVQLVARINAVWALAWMYNGNTQTGLLEALGEGDAELQRVVVEVLGLWAAREDRAVNTALLRTLADEDRAVRRTVALAMGRLAGPGASDSLATALSFDDGRDPMLRDGLARSLEMLGKGGIDALIALLDSGVQKDTDRVVETFQGLRTRAGFDALVTVLKNPHLSSGQRADLLLSCVNYVLDPPASLEPIVTYLATQPKETPTVKKAMLEVLTVPGLVKGAQAKAYVEAMLADANEEVQQAARKARKAMPAPDR